jgi:CubicO group peptidase (beta-lactamase class C family)
VTHPVGIAAVLAAFTAASLIPAPAPAQTARDTLAMRVDSIFADVNRASSPGCSLGVIRDGLLVYVRGYGMANLDEGIALSPASAFYIASTSKQFAAASVLLLAQEGKLSLDDDIRKFFPELPDYGAPVTVRHLLHHTSGLRDYLGLMMGLGAGRVENVMSDDEIVALIARQKGLNFRPGTEYSYSNSGYFLLGQIVKRVTGTSLRAYADAKIFRPLGMTHTHFHDDRLQIIPHRVIGYDPAASGFTLDYYGNFQGVGDGGLWTTVEDLATWDRNFYDPKVGGPTLLKELHTRGVLTSGDTLGYASGLQLGTYRGLETVSHGGSLMGYRTEFLRFPAQRFSVICLCNLSTSNPSARARKVADIYLSGELRPVAVADAASASPSVELASNALAALSGTYRNPTSGMVSELAVRDGRLTATLFGTRVPLTALSATHFRSSRSGLPLDVVFELRPDGQATRAHVTIGDDAKPDLYERIERVTPTAARLAEYAGDYDSPELGVAYTFSARGDSLYVAIPTRPKLALTPTARDGFVVAGMSFIFVRDAAARITAVTVWAPQTRNIRLERRRSSPRS